MRYAAPAPPSPSPPVASLSVTAKYLVPRDATTSPPSRYVFFDHIEIGRDEEDREATPGTLLVPGPTVSWTHCIVTQTADGRCMVRDLSRNGTRVDGRRLVPNAQEEIRVGQTLTIGTEQEFVLEAEPLAGPSIVDPDHLSTTASLRRTISKPNLAVVTVLVGDIRDYTMLVRRASAELQRSVSRVFELLTAAVIEHGGTVKEFQGDAIVAFWEKHGDGDEHAVAACRAALELNRLSRRIADDPGVWELTDHPLRIDWALATGLVTIDSFGPNNPMGLSIIGKPVVLAFRLEKLVTDETGPMIACLETRTRASRFFRFRDLGYMNVKGFDEPYQVFELERESRVSDGKKSTSMRVLVTGATGYVGGRLVPQLLADGYEVVCLARDPSYLVGRDWPGVEVRRGDALSPGSLLPALEGADVAYYLIHSMSAGDGPMKDRDRAAAQNFALAAQAAGIRRIIYLGGLGRPEETLSTHLASRHEVGDILRSSGVPVTEFRAATIVGSGSISFEIIRYLAESFPVVFTPRWMTTRAQPISITNVLDYLLLALDDPRSEGRIFEIGGPDVLTYAEMVRGYAAERSLRRVLVPMPILTPGLSSLVLHLLTPIPADIARPLVEGMRHELVVRDHAAEKLFDVRLISYREAVRRALRRIVSGDVETFWSGARPPTAPSVRLTFAKE